MRRDWQNWVEEGPLREERPCDWHNDAIDVTKTSRKAVQAAQRPIVARMADGQSAVNYLAAPRRCGGENMDRERRGHICRTIGGKVAFPWLAEGVSTLGRAGTWRSCEANGDGAFHESAAHMVDVLVPRRVACWSDCRSPGSRAGRSHEAGSRCRGVAAGADAASRLRGP